MNTKSTITREESVQAVFDLKVGYTLELADIEILKRVARMALAMLQAEPVTTANKLGNSPVIPDTWIPVSERMPENDVSVLTFDGMYKRVHHAMYGHWQCWEPEKITHWMPLPAAPQEVKP